MVHRVPVLIRLYQGAIKALLRLYEGSMKALLRLYEGFIQKACGLPVILRGDVHLVGEHVLDGLVVAAVAELELVCLAPCRAR